MIIMIWINVNKLLLIGENEHIPWTFDTYPNEKKFYDVVRIIDLDDVSQMINRYHQNHH